MPLPKTLFGTVRNIPITDETGWGAVVTAVLADLIDAADSLGLLLGSDVILFRSEATSTALAGAGTLTQTHPTHHVASTGGAVVLDAVTAIADGQIDGQLLTLIGTSDVNTVEVPDGANTQLQGPCVLTDGDALSLRWDVALSVWQEISRNN